MDIENCILIIIAAIVIYLIFDLIFGTPVLSVLATTCILSPSDKNLEKIGGGLDIPKLAERPDNLAYDLQSKSIKLKDLQSKSIKLKDSQTKNYSHQKNYDEYDDDKLLKKLDLDKIKLFDNVVIDGNNFLYKYHNYIVNSSNISAKEYLSYIKTIVKLISTHFPTKNLYFVFKDPETDRQKQELLDELNVDTVKKAHRKFFGDLAKKYPKVRFIVAYGEAKYRDDYAAIWLADTLPDDTILLSRDRYKDVVDMQSAKLTFNTYGRRASAINKIINKPFNFVTKGAVKSVLVGYSFSKTNVNGFYSKDVNHKSSASDLVYIFKI